MTGLEVAMRLTRGACTLSVEVRVESGRVLAVVGPNGSGKSSLLLALAGVLPIDEGSIVLHNRVLDSATDRATFVPPEDRGIGVVFQDSLLFPHVSVLDNVAFGPRERGQSRGAAREVAREKLASLGAAELAHRRPSHLSGGEAQRVALARALATDPGLLLLDEPLASLDVNARDEVRDALLTTLESFEGAAVFVSHDRDDVMALADEVLVLDGGQAVQRGTTVHVAESPRGDFARRFFAG